MKKPVVRFRVQPVLASGLLVAAVVLAGLLIVPATPAQAADIVTSPALERGDGTRLEFLLRRIQLVRDGLEYRIDLARQAADIAQDWIDVLSEEGHDVSTLQAALDDYRAGIDAAEESLNTATSVLDEHAGFDDEGKVTDRDQAIETLRNAGRPLRDAHRTLRDATIQFRRAVQDFRQQALEDAGGSQTDQ